MEFFDSRDSLSTPSDSPARGDLDVAPDSHIVFFSPSYFNAQPTRSTAKAKQKRKGVYSHDPILDRNPGELWRFLVANLRPPRLVVRLKGYHFETDEANPTTDFSIQVDISHLVTQWSQLYAHRHGASWSEQVGTKGAGPTLREAVEEYTSSRHRFKEFRMRKLVLWDSWRVKKALKALVRSTGYSHYLIVDFPMEDYKVVALASNEYSRSAHSKLVRALCCVSCLCIVFWPAWAVARKRIDCVTCEYRTTLSADQFLLKMSSAIRLAVLQGVGYKSSSCYQPQTTSP